MHYSLHIQMMNRLKQSGLNFNGGDEGGRLEEYWYRERKNSPFISLLISTYFIAFKFGLGLGQRWTRLQIFQVPRSLLLLKHAKFLQSALSLFGGIFPCKLSNIAAYIIGAFFRLLRPYFAAFCWMGVILFSVIYVFRGR